MPCLETTEDDDVHKPNNKMISKFLIPGIILGGLSFTKPILLVLLGLAGCLIFYLSQCDPSVKKPLTNIIAGGLICRILFTFLAILYVAKIHTHAAYTPLTNFIIGHSGQLFRDIDREIDNGIHLGDFFSGNYGPLILSEAKKVIAVEGISSFLHLGAYLQGLLNFLFGHSLLNLLFYPFLGIWAVILTYELGRETFNRRVALVAAGIIAFMPSFIIWSSINIRMSLAIMSLLAIVLAFVKFSRKNHPKYLLLISLAYFVMLAAKKKLALNSMPLLPLLFFLILRIPPTVKKVFCLFILVLSAITLFKNTRAQSGLNTIEQEIIATQRAYYLDMLGSNYKIYDDIFYTPEAASQTHRISSFTLLKALPKGLFYFFFTPFLWKISNNLQLFSYPQALFWFFTIPFCIWGIFLGIRYRPKESAILLSISLFWVILLSLVMGNIGTIARHRDLVLPFLYIFGSAGFCHAIKMLKFPTPEQKRYAN